MAPRILFVLPGTHISGGGKVMFETADRLLERGHETHILTPNGRPPAWFDLKTPVSRQEAWRQHIRAEDHVVFNWDYDIGYVLSVNGHKWYYIMHFRHPIEEIFSLPLDGFWSISTYIQKHTLETYGAPSYLTRTAIDPEAFYPRKDVQRHPLRVMALAWGGWKGWDDFEQAIALVQEEEPDVDVLPVNNLTSEQMARAYSSSAVFVSASYYEGFGLPPLEAMACGAAVVTTDSKGVDDFAIHEDTCLKVPVTDPPAMAHAILRLLRDQSLRERLVSNGLKKASEFRWEPTIDRLERILRLVSEPPDPAWLGPATPTTQRPPADGRELEEIISHLRQVCRQHYAMPLRSRVRATLRSLRDRVIRPRGFQVRPISKSLGKN